MWSMHYISTVLAALVLSMAVSLYFIGKWYKVNKDRRPLVTPISSKIWAMMRDDKIDSCVYNHIIRPLSRIKHLDTEEDYLGIVTINRWKGFYLSIPNHDKYWEVGIYKYPSLEAVYVLPQCKCVSLGHDGNINLEDGKYFVSIRCGGKLDRKFLGDIRAKYGNLKARKMIVPKDIVNSISWRPDANQATIGQRCERTTVFPYSPYIRRYIMMRRVTSGSSITVYWFNRRKLQNCDNVCTVFIGDERIEMFIPLDNNRDVQSRTWRTSQDCMVQVTEMIYGIHEHTHLEPIRVAITDNSQE